jgi:hypothetical protein
MDATLIGVVGSLAGVAIGASTQHYQASARRGWELEDSEREKRRETYAKYISTVDEYQAAAIQHLALLAMSAPEERQRSKRQEIDEIDQRLRSMGGPLSMVASEMVDLQIAVFSSMLLFHHTQKTHEGEGGLDLEWMNWIVSERTNLIQAMRDDLAGKRPRRSRVRRLFSKRAAPSRRRIRAPIPSSLQRLAGEDASPQAQV